MQSKVPPSPDTRLNAIGVLTRREIEARILAPLIAAFSREFGREQVTAIARQVIVRVAREQGVQLAEAMGGSTLGHFAASLDAWVKDDALRIEILEQSEDRFSFNVTRCRYAEMYSDLGIPELGAVLSCNRDYALIGGFNPAVDLIRTQTIMEGAPYCDFRYALEKPENRVEVKVKTLLVLRHAKSSWKEADLADHDRPLNKRGKHNAPRMGRLLRELDLVPDLIISSTAKRAWDTAEAVADQCGCENEVVLNEDLYSFESGAYLEALRDLPDAYSRVMVVGHNPGLEELVDLLTGESVGLPTAALAQVTLPIHSWQELTDETEGRLLNIWRPKELP